MLVFLETHGLFKDGFRYNFILFITKIVLRFLESICPFTGQQFTDESSISPPGLSVYIDGVRTAVLVLANDDTWFCPLFSFKVLDQHFLARVQVLLDLGMLIKILLGVVPCGSVLLLGSMRLLRWITYYWESWV